MYVHHINLSLCRHHGSNHVGLVQWLRLPHLPLHKGLRFLWAHIGKECDKTGSMSSTRADVVCTESYVCRNGVYNNVLRQAQR